MHGKGVSEVVEPGPSPPAPVGDPARPQKLAEGTVDSLRSERSGIGSGKEQIVWSPPACVGRQVAFQPSSERGCNRDEAVLAELPVTNSQNVTRRINVSDLQASSLADAQPASVEQPE